MKISTDPGTGGSSCLEAGRNLFRESPGSTSPRSKKLALIRQGDYWTIRYQRQTAILKATRGLDCLGYLLRHPTRDVHVSELLRAPIDLPAPVLLGGLWEVGCNAVTAGLPDVRANSRFTRQGRIQAAD